MVDTSPCLSQIKAGISEPGLRFALYEPVEFIRHFLVDKLEFNKVSSWRGRREGGEGVWAAPKGQGVGGGVGWGVEAGWSGVVWGRALHKGRLEWGVGAPQEPAGLFGFGGVAQLSVLQLPKQLGPSFVKAPLCHMPSYSHLLLSSRDVFSPPAAAVLSTPTP